MSSDNTDRIMRELEQAINDWADADMGLTNEPQWLRDAIWAEHDRIQKEYF